MTHKVNKCHTTEPSSIQLLHPASDRLLTRIAENIIKHTITLTRVYLYQPTELRCRRKILKFTKKILRRKISQIFSTVLFFIGTQIMYVNFRKPLYTVRSYSPAVWVSAQIAAVHPDTVRSHSGYSA